MRTTENSKVGIAEKTDYLPFYGEKCSPCQQTRMPSTKSDDSDQFDAEFTEDVGTLSGSPELYGLISYKEYKEELFRISDKTIDLHAKDLLSDSGTECFLLPDSEEEETSLDSGNGTRSEETTDPDSEGQDEGDLEDAEGGTLPVPNDDISASQDGKNDAEDLSEDSCEMTYIELDLSSQSDKDISDDEIDMELMMKNLKIGPSKISVHSDSYQFDSCDAKPVNVCVDDRFDEENVDDLKLGESAETQVFNLHNDIKGNSAVNLIHNSGQEYTSSNLKRERRPEFFGSFLPISESSLCSLPERTYVQIAERLLDERTQLRLNAEENDLFSSDSCRTTLNTHDIPFVPSEMESSNQDLKCSFTPDEMDPTYKMCPMTYVDLDVNEPCPVDISLKMFNNLNIKDDKNPLRRGNPSDQNGIQNHPLCSQIDTSDSELPTVDVIDNPPFLIERSDTEMDFNSLANVINDSSMQDFYSSQTFPSSSVEFNFSSTVCLPSFSNDCITKTFKTCPEDNTVEEMSPSVTSFPKSSFLPPGASSVQRVNSPCDVSFFDNTLENGETHYENEFVTKNVHKLKEIYELLGLSNPESQKTVLPSSPPLSSNNVLPLFSSKMCVTNLTTVENSFPTTPQSFDSNVVPRVTTQTPGTQSDAIPAFPGILVVLSTSSMHGLKRPPCIEMSEPAKKPFGFDNLNNFGLSEADSRKKAKQVVASLTDKQLLEFKNNESCLHEAVRTTNYEYVWALLKRLRNFHSHHLDIINSKNEKSQTALHLAVQENIPAIVHLLIKYGAEVNYLAMTPSRKLEAPLHYVASRGIQFKLVLKCLLKANDLDINIKNSEGQTALHCAALAHGTGGSNSAHSIDSEYIIKKLLTSADPLIQDKNGKNVLMYAIESKDLNLVSHIIKTVRKDHIQELLAATTSNGQTCLSLSHSLKEQYNQIQWEKLINMLTCHTSSN